MSEISDPGAPGSGEDAAIAAFAGLPVAVIADTLDALGHPSTVMDASIRLLSGSPVVGRARTVDRAWAPVNANQGQVAPDLGMGTQDVIDSCCPDDIIVIATRDELRVGVWGDNMATRASALGVRAVVTDGAVRDLDEMPKLNLSVFAQATCPRQATRRMLTLAIDKPVLCGGVMVRPGDILVGDRDGIVAVPAEHALAVAARAREIHGVEEGMQAYIREGNTLVSAVNIYKQR
ncbi:MAG TPA: hypothetical protein VIL69_14140 [Roseomonas sp.]